ncbi:uncharacterized protein LOC141898272 [Tubulanus polymorphus]|uniref:uncharacterized protein LOC141898272 n=1 Tax=Tubulanus polymorphus TaxID=672921 RepID=UPI003DA26FB3
MEDCDYQDSPVSSSAQELDNNINTIISSLDSELDLSNPNQDSPILNGVVAYVEVRSGNENRGKGVIAVLRKLGAEIRLRFTNDVTHVVFKEGTKRTVEKAKKKGIKVVSVLWVDSCREKGRLVPEADFLFSETGGGTPQPRKLKKHRSMQPKDYEEDLANSSERWKKTYQKRIEERQKEQPLWKNIYVPDSQPDFNFLMGPGSPNLSIPETPPSMKRKLAELREKELAMTSTKMIEETPVSDSVFADVHVRLFKNNKAPPPKYDSELMDMSQVMHSSCESTASKAISSPSAVNGSVIPVRFGCSPSENSTYSHGLNSAPTSSPDDPLTLRVTPSPKSFDTVINTQDLLEAVGNRSKVGDNSMTETSHQHNSSASTVTEEVPLMVEKTVRKKRKLLRNSFCELAEKLISPKVSSNRVQTNPIIPVSTKPQSGDKERRRSNVNKTMASKRKHSSTTAECNIPSVETNNIRKKRKTVSGEGVDNAVVESQQRQQIPEVELNSPAENQKKPRRKSSQTKSRSNSRNRSTIGSDTDDNSISINSPTRLNSSITTPSGIFNVAEETSSKDQLNSAENTPTVASVTRRRSLISPRMRRSPGDSLTKRRSMRKSLQVVNSNMNDLTSSKNCSRTSIASLNDELSTTSINSPKAPTQSTPRRSSRRSISALSISNISSPTRLSTSSISTAPRNERSIDDEKSKNSCIDKISDAEKTRRRKSGRPSSALGSVPECDVLPIANQDFVVQTVVHDYDTTPRNIANRSESEIVTRSPLTSRDVNRGDRSGVLETLLSANKRQSVDEFSARRKTHGARRLKRFESYSTAFSDSDSNEGTARKKLELKNNERKKTKKSLNEQNIENLNVDCRIKQAKTTSNRSLTTNKTKSCSRLSQFPTLVMTSLHKSERDIVQSVVKKLRGFTIVPSVNSTTTHVVSGQGRRTLNVLNAIARGCWLLSTEWVYKSLEADKWLPETSFQQIDCFPTCQVSRHERSLSTGSYRPQIFSDYGSIFIAENCAPPRDVIVNLVKICGGTVSHLSI